MTNGNFCDLAKPITVSHEDTSLTKRQILTLNEKYEKFCGK